MIIQWALLALAIWQVCHFISTGINNLYVCHFRMTCIDNFGTSVNSWALVLTIWHVMIVIS